MKVSECKKLLKKTGLLRNTLEMKREVSEMQFFGCWTQSLWYSSLHRKPVIIQFSYIFVIMRFYALAILFSNPWLPEQKIMRHFRVLRAGRQVPRRGWRGRPPGHQGRRTPLRLLSHRGRQRLGGERLRGLCRDLPLPSMDSRPVRTVTTLILDNCCM